MKAEISYDLIIEGDMDFVEGAYRLADGDWQVVIASKHDLIDPSPRPFRFTREQYYQLGDLNYFEGCRVERINGEIYEMSPLGWLHVLAKTKTADILRTIFAGMAWVNEQGVLPTDSSDPQP